MSFLHSGLFWGGLGVTLIPLIIHLLNKRRFRPLEWAAMEFLLKAIKKNRRRVRIEQLILLLIRTLLVLFILLAIVRPHLSTSPLAWLGENFQSEEKLVLIDDSLSMGYQEGGESSLERGLKAVSQSAEKLALKSGRAPFSIYRTSAFQSPVFSAPKLSISEVQSLRDRLDPASFPATSTRANYQALFDELAQRPSPTTGRTITIITDLCKNDWLHSGGAAIEDLQRALQKLTSNEKTPHRLRILNVGAKRRNNTAITGLSLTRPDAIVGVPVQLAVEISNFGQQATPEISLRIRTEKSVLPGPKVEPIPGGEKISVEIPHTFHQSGSQWIRVEFEGTPDGLKNDDQRELVVEVLDAIPVLVIDGEPSNVFGKGESDLLNQALNPQGEIASGFSPKVILDSNYKSENFDSYGAIYLLNVATLTEDFAEKLNAYIQLGGALFIFPGDQVDLKNYHQHLGAGTQEKPGLKLLPGILEEPTGDVARPAHLVPQWEHPAFRLLKGAGENLFSLVDIYRYFPLQLYEEAKVLGTLTEPENAPWLAEKSVGKGRVILSTIPADLEWTSWPRNPSFLPVILELSSLSSKSRSLLWNRQAGTTVQIPIDLSQVKRQAYIRSPEYPTKPQQRVQAQQIEEASEEGKAEEIQFAFLLEDTRTNGIYQLIQESLSGQEIVRPLAIHSDPEESQLSVLADAQLLSSYEGLPIEILDDPSQLMDAGDGRFEISDFLWVLVLILIFIEMTYAWWSAHHKKKIPVDAEVTAKPFTRGGLRDKTRTSEAWK